jgi:hypothetical protein
VSGGTPWPTGNSPRFWRRCGRVPPTSLACCWRRWGAPCPADPRTQASAAGDAAIAQIPRYARHQIVQARIDLMRDEEQVVFVAVHAERVVENSNRCANDKIGPGLAREGPRPARRYACRGAQGCAVTAITYLTTMTRTRGHLSLYDRWLMGALGHRFRVLICLLKFKLD